MILRRVMEHVRTQNWLAVGIDFVIVVVGVFIGIQLGNWNESAAERRQLDRQLIAFADELERNLDELSSYRDAKQARLDAINEVRAALAEADGDVEEDTLNAGLFAVTAVTNYRPETVAFDDLAASDAFSTLAGTPLREEISKWEADVVYLQRLDRDALEHRDHIALPFITEHLSFAAVLARGQVAQAAGFTPSSFKNDRVAPEDLRTLDGVLAIRFGTIALSVVVAERLMQQTEDLIDLLPQEGSR
ncbi:hypothetical protein HK107_09370 [Parvularcula sp. ZS-1/3]|uniref:Uncharacterized protein n=1 Tax=Parvularcula mediterranea TaxID=2732508 RepID=A0A7Y3RLY4_9PROT|nr:DUF6090 family protein [Parvularcula mediterranea]NNU16528.1 hypothetical protein [Parvularcula mediterranea]